MMRAWLSVLMLMVLLFPGTASLTYAGGPDGDTSLVLGDHRPHVIENVTAAFSGWYPVGVTLRVSGYQPDSCEFPVQIDQQRDGNDVYVAIFRDVPSNTRCREATIPYEAAILLEDEFESGTYTIHVNDYVLEISIPPRSPRDDGGGEPPPVDTLVKSYAWIDYVEVFAYDRGYPSRVEAHVVGAFVEGCEVSHEIAQRREGRSVYIEIFQWINPMALCEARPRPLDEFISLDGDFRRGTYTLYVNDFVTEFTVPPVEPPPPPQRSYVIIESVEALVLESYPMQIHLHVTGYYSSGCQSEVFVDQWREGNEVFVEVYQLVNPMIMCPEMLTRYDAIIPLEGGFVSGRYLIHVNDYVLRLRL